MLQIQNIVKEYHTGGVTQRALKGVSLNLRDNEFVAILGQSGSGKTTLLNIIGGLDRYDSGDLIIGGVSTKKYKDRDWDSYRNHTIGFVFQSYNLIMHQSVLANVELALTISGISGSERRKKAMRALERVGLGEQMHKKPGQMSGGQMQRVAIARALVNDPDIVLADEPTGALDSETSVQVMDLLQEVAKDRLVVMVTHNPELARQYATRIVTIKDGEVIGDTDPFTPDAAQIKPPVHKNMGHSSMSFLTALSLSFNNLRTKKARTLLVAFAGSIGIIGIAMILSLSNGVNAYIKDQESDTLSQYPLQLQSTGYDLTSLLTGISTETTTVTAAAEQAAEAQTGDSGSVGVMNVVEQMFSGVSTNDLASLKTYFESGESDIYDYVSSIEYQYNITPQIYRLSSGGVLQVNPNTLMSSMSSASSSENSFTQMMNVSLSTDLFSQLPSNAQLYEDNYEVKAGHWPEDDHELVLVLSAYGQVSDLLLYAMGLRDEAELDQMIDDFASGITQSTDSSAVSETYAYEDFLGITFRLVPSYLYYEYDSEYEVWTDKSDNEVYLKKLVRQGKELEIVGVVQPKSSTSISILSQGIAYTSDLIETLIEDARSSEVVSSQLADKETNVLTGQVFGDEDAEAFDLSSLFSVDEDVLQEMFSMDDLDLSSLDMGSLDFSSMDLSGMDLSSLDFSSMDLSGMDLSSLMPSLSADQISELMGAAFKDITPEQLQELLGSTLTGLMEGYEAYAETNGIGDISDLGSQVADYLGSEDVRTILSEQMEQILSSASANVITEEELRSMVTSIAQGFVSSVLGNGEVLQDILSYGVTGSMESLTEKYWAAFSNYLNSAQEVTELAASAKDALSSITISQTQVQDLAQALYNGYETWAQDNDSISVSAVSSSFGDYIQTDEAQQLLLSAAGEIMDTDALTKSVTAMFSNSAGSLAGSMGTQISAVITQMMSSVASSMSGSISSMMSQVFDTLSTDMTSLFEIDPETLSEMISVNMSGEDIQTLMTSLLNGSSSTLDSNLSAFGYADPDSPIEIDVYSRDFDSKNDVITILNTYNQDVANRGEEEKVITYTDLVGTMMTSVTKIVDTVSYVLIAFVAISLVVSSIMIGVITYISVLERRTEIGILRAIGASKNNVSQVFNAEAFITGLLSGLIGVITTILLTIPLNYVIRSLVNQEGVRASLPGGSAVLLVGLSVVLSLIAGLIPSRKAAKSDPVTALRSE